MEAKRVCKNEGVIWKDWVASSSLGTSFSSLSTADRYIAIARYPSAFKADMSIKEGAKLQVATEDVNAIQRGRLYLIAHIGELLPAKQGKRNDLTSESDFTKLPFSGPTLTNYRKVAGFKTAIDSHFESRDDDEPVSVENPSIPYAAI